MSRPFPRTVTVFGATGFIGRYLVRRLAQQDAVVRVATRNPRKANFLRPNGVVGQVVPVPCNIHDDASVRRALDGADAAVNLVGILAETGKQSFEAVHAAFPARLGRLAADCGVRTLTHVSAIGADAAATAKYAASKGAGETRLRAGFPDAAILRPSIVFGPEDDFFNRFAQMARLSPVLPLIGGGETKFQPVYVVDVADALLATLRDPGTRGVTYELGGPRVYSFRALMQHILDEIRVRKPLVTIPWGLAKLQASILEKLPGQVLTQDQVAMLKSDNVVSEGARTLADLGIEAEALEVITPTYLERFREGGRFAHEDRLTA